MPVPKRKTCRWKRDQRRAHIKLNTTSLIKCTNCGEQTMPHRVCDSCGFYGETRVMSKKS